MKFLTERDEKIARYTVEGKIGGSGSCQYGLCDVDTNNVFLITIVSRFPSGGM